MGAAVAPCGELARLREIVAAAAELMPAPQAGRQTVAGGFTRLSLGDAAAQAGEVLVLLLRQGGPGLLRL